MLKLKDLYHFTIRCIVHKFIHSPHLLKVVVNEVFFLNEQTHDYNTRNKEDLHLIKIKQNYMEKNYFISKKKLLERLVQEHQGNKFNKLF